ncbi:Glycogen accumulation regulator GarA [Acaryochloris thomasi RCC1774]|uniref:Glycogen accumulation regulator GarA n=1 Tax=Acaryochloris thomasi RCC1774 TaxID=1764569 RepID=A0A2W1JD10_9CYAN|nr:FHA domain-containing protein [Acaryochloris thomasi]PZD71793.1 Glycogen accumulation regulator GarA [Acaryochloris thomasi RCC1774]
MGTSFTPQLIIHNATGASIISLEDQDVWTVGRGPENDIILDEHTVSRHHAKIQHQGPGEYRVADVGSGNGSFVNGKRIVMSHILQHGDRLTMGRIQLEFQGSRLEEALPSPPRKTILMLHSSALQSKVWQEVLTSQGVAVAHLNPSTNLSNLLTHRAASQDLPDLLLLDMTGIRDNPYHFCRWCRDTYPQIKVVLMSGKRTEVSDSERKWAIHQGAIDLLAGFPEPQLFNNLIVVTTKVKSVLQILDWPEIQQQKLLDALLAIQTLRKQSPRY